jgi:hypothetical protein
MAHRYRVKHRHHHHRRGNPLGINGGVIKDAIWGVGGGIGALALPAAFLPSQNSGAIGYLLNIGSAVALKFVVDMVDKGSSDAVLKGGLVATGLRIAKDNASMIPGLSGLGAYWTSYLPNLPTQSNPYGQMPNPAPQIAAPAAGAKAMSGSRFGSRFRR